MVPLLLLALAATPLPTQESLDLTRYAGRWYEIARMPSRFQERCVGDVTVDYTMQEDGRLKVRNECRQADGTTARAEGVARRAEAGGPASKLEVRFAPGWLSFLPWVWGNYWVLAVDPDYRWAMVGEPSRKYLWILSRTPELDPAVTEKLLADAARAGYDVTRVSRTAQTVPTTTP